MTDVCLQTGRQTTHEHNCNREMERERTGKTGQEVSEKVRGVREFENPLLLRKGARVWGVGWGHMAVEKIRAEEMEGGGGSRPGPTVSLRRLLRLGGVRPCGPPEVLLLVCVASKPKNRTLHLARQSLTQAVVTSTREETQLNRRKVVPCRAYTRTLS